MSDAPDTPPEDDTPEPVTLEVQGVKVVVTAEVEG